MFDGRGQVIVFGPAYLDSVVLVDRPLGGGRAPLDASVDGARVVGPARSLTLVDPSGSRIAVELPEGWAGPAGAVKLSRPLGDGPGGWTRAARAIGFADELGGMGAGYAASLGGVLVSALGPESDPTGLAIESLLRREGIPHRPIRVAGYPSDSTLLISSGPHGDKLPIGFRGCHAHLPDLPNLLGASDRLDRARVVAALPNRLVAGMLGDPGPIRMFAPNLRNMLDREPPVTALARSIDVLSCNRSEWDHLPDRDAVAARVPIVAITDGPLGAEVRFTATHGGPTTIRIPAFPRSCPIVDTNRAGEAFASGLLATLLEAGWTPGPASPDLIRVAAERGSAAAALTLGLAGFGFPSRAEVVAAIRLGVAGSVGQGGVPLVG